MQSHSDPFLTGRKILFHFVVQGGNGDFLPVRHHGQRAVFVDLSGLYNNHVAKDRETVEEKE